MSGWQEVAEEKEKRKGGGGGGGGLFPIQTLTNLPSPDVSHVSELHKRPSLETSVIGTSGKLSGCNVLSLSFSASGETDRTDGQRGERQGVR